MKHNALVFDLETIADLTPENRDGIAGLAKGRDMTPEAYGGLCPPLARVVCISWFDLAAQKLGALFDASLCAGEYSVSMDIEAGSGDIRTCEVQGCDSEAHLLKQFGRVVEQHLVRPQAQLVTYNGRGFDFPVLIHRSIKHRVIEGRELFMKAVGENRYRPLIHLDLQDAVTFYGAASRFPLAAYAIGYGGRSPKHELDGSKVWGAVQSGQIIDVVRYCVGDVLATAHVYLCMNGLATSPDSRPNA
ncbi:MAG TPA: ribonuclease H-like domain-containing protein [Candidatus Binatia bacterium]